MAESNLVKLDQATRMLAEIKTVDDAKHIINIAEAARVYAQQASLGLEAQNHAAEIKIRAQRKAGELLLQMDKAKGGNPNLLTGCTLQPVETLADIGIEKTAAHRWQTIASMPEEQFEKVIAENKGEQELTTALVYKLIKTEENLKLRHDRLTEETKDSLQEQAIVIKGDCMDVLKSIDPIDLLLTDPPYFTDGDFTEQISKCLAKVKNTGQAYVFASSDPNEILAYLNMDTRHMNLEQIIVWNYNNTGQRQPNNRYTSNYQIAFYYRGSNAQGINKPGDGTHQYACQTVNAPDGRIGDRYHEWQKPIELMERLIRNSSSIGDFVFDPFAGTGTTLLAAAKLGRRTTGCDIDHSAIKICLDRGCILG